MLTKEEIELLKANPATASLGAKLETEQFIPKSRFDEVNQRAKEATEALNAKIEAEKKAAETSAMEQGKFKELLQKREEELTSERATRATIEKEKASLETKAKAYEETQANLRKKALDNIKDAELKKIAEKLPSVEDVVEFSEKVTKQKIQPFTGKTEATEMTFKNARDWENQLRAKGLAQ